MNQSVMMKVVFFIYDLAWSLIVPLLRLNRRLADGYQQRCFRYPLPEPADVWIQAASVGESFLACELLKHWPIEGPMRILITTNTRQGKEILEKSIAKIGTEFPNIKASTAYFPFDKPAIMQRAVAHLRPRLMILLETELWPAHLSALKDAGVSVLLLNGRITAKSLKHYRLLPSLWHHFRPDQILAVSEADAQRFARLFGDNRIGVMPNIKFDRLGDLQPLSSPNPLVAIFPDNKPLLVLGSVREPEEEAVQKIIQTMLDRHPDIVVAVFPRHAHRIEAWKKFFESRGLAWNLRSGIQKPVSAGTVVLWDTFGELSHAYSLATTAFVGGSLAPLGGQNFLEPLISGIRPVIGPYWETFYWIGEEIMELGLVRIVGDWKEAADTLSRDVMQPAATEKVRREARRYIAARQGGTAMACTLIRQYLENEPAIHRQRRL